MKQLLWFSLCKKFWFWWPVVLKFSAQISFAHGISIVLIFIILRFIAFSLQFFRRLEKLLLLYFYEINLDCSCLLVFLTWTVINIKLNDCSYLSFWKGWFAKSLSCVSKTFSGEIFVKKIAESVIMHNLIDFVW